MNINDLEDILDEEVDVYSITNSLDDETTEELRFVTSSFAKYYKKQSRSKNFLDTLNDFDATLEVISTGVMGTGFKTNAPQLYKNLPTIKEMSADCVADLEAKVRELEEANKDLATKNEELELDILSFKKAVQELKDDLKAATKKMSSGSSSSSSSGSYGSYGGCGGGYGSSYGRC